MLFWNLNLAKGDSARILGSVEGAALVARIVRQFDVEVLVLAECSIENDLLLDTLRRDADSRFETPGDLHVRFQFHTRFPWTYLDPWLADNRMAIHRLSFPGHQDILLVAFHFIDGWNNSPEKQFRSLAPYRQTLLNAERTAEHSRTILFGDLNMNPFDAGMLDPVLGLGAMVTRDLAAIHSEKIGPLRFYNPMWTVMGRSETPGTYYWPADEPTNTYWNCPDGVLLRPSLLDAFHDEDLRIIRRIAGPDGAEIDLIRLAEKHWKLSYSDHLPLTFKVSIPKLAQQNRGTKMPESGRDLWGTDFEAAPMESAPVGLLKEQAEALTRRTGGLVVGDVLEDPETDAGTVWISLYAKVPALRDYRYKLVTIAHPVVVADPKYPFPLTVFNTQSGENSEVGEMQSLIDWLSHTLSSSEIHNVIANLLKYGGGRAAS